MAGEIALMYIKDALPELHKRVLRGEGRRVTGIVQGRPDDSKIEIDTFGERVVERIILRDNLPIRVYSEHADPFIGAVKRAKIKGGMDPFDNSSQYLRGLPTPVFSCFSEYNSRGNPLAGVVADLRAAKVYLSILGKNVVIDDFLNGSAPRPIHKSDRTTIKDVGITIASYTGSKEYALQFYSDFDEDEGKIKINFGKMIKDMDRKGRTYADGGAFIYALLAEGVVDAYVMRNEPISEIAPGAALALTAGCVLWCVDKNGKIRDYRFNPKKFRDEVYLFITAGTPELAREIYDYYFKYRDKRMAA